MANLISQVKLPNNTTYTIRDPNARPLSNNDFDTINVTELNAGDLIVTGGARFLNAINGNISGNSATATSATSATKATQDESGNNIKSTYANAISISDHTITLKNKNGTSLGTVTVPDNNTTYAVATGTANGEIKVTPSIGSAYPVKVYGLKSAAYKDVTDTYSATGTDPVSGKAVAAAIDALPEPMVFKGSLGTGGTITTLPVDGTAKVGDTYKVITAGTYASKSAKVGDTFICLTKTSSANTWELIPSGDEPAGTVTSVAVANGGGLSVSGSPITSSGTITISHADTSSQASVDNSGRTYIQDISLDTYGHVTKITSATETVVNTDRYVNSAAFADATSADANNPVKMTLTRAGSDTASVTAYIPKVSSSSAGVAPKGAAVSSQSQSTKFLREDGTWAAPSYTTNTNTTYSLSASGESVVLSGSDNSSSTADLSTAFANYMPKAGGTFTGRVVYNNVSMPLAAGKVTGLTAGTTEIFKNAIAFSNPATSNDLGWIRVLGTGESDTVLEIATGDDGGGSTAEKIVARQYNTSNAIAKEAVLLAPDGTTSFPVSVTAPKFIGALQGNADTATSATSATKATQDGSGNVITTTYLPKTTYEWNKEVSFGSSGYLKIGSFAMYDSNVTIEINSTANTTYHGTLVIATQNVTDSSIGSVHVVKVYDDPTGVIASSLRIVWTSGSRNYDVYFVPSNWSKNLIHIQALGLYGYSDICTAQTGTAPTTTSGLEPINVLESKSAASGGTDVSMVTTGEKATWNAKGSGTITSVKTTAGAHTTINVTSGAANFNVPTKTSHLTNDSGFVTQDTKNTAGSTDTSSKIFLIGATSQAANPQTYSQDTAYVGTDGCLYSGGSKVLTAHQDISGKVSKTGDTMSGALTVEASNSYSSYNEGIRINAGARTYATLLMGGTAGTTSGINDGAFWIGVYNTGGTARRLMIAHNGSYATGTYFYASSASNVSPSLAIGTDLKVAGVVYASSNNGGTAGGISLYQSSAPTDYGLAMRTTTNSGKHGAVQSDWAVYNYMINSGTNRGWIWKNAASGGGNVASIDCAGNAVFNGYVGIGGNTTNTSGVRQVYNSTTKSLDFVFVA